MDKKAVVAIVILSVIILGLGGFIVADKFLLNKKEEAEITKIGDVDIDLNVFSQIDETLDKLDKAYNKGSSKFFGYLYSKNKLTVDKFDKEAALYLALNSRLIGTNTPQDIPGALVKADFERIFSKSLKYNPASVNIASGYDIVYDSTSDKYSYNLPVANNIYSPEYIEKSISTSLEDDSVIIKRKVFYVEYEIDPAKNIATKAYVYTSHDKSKLVATLELKNNVVNPKEVIGKYGSKLSTYKYTFQSKSVDEYTLYSIEKEK